jgi:hypothetical protein
MICTCCCDDGHWSIEVIRASLLNPLYLVSIGFAVLQMSSRRIPMNNLDFSLAITAIAVPVGAAIIWLLLPLLNCEWRKSHKK